MKSLFFADNHVSSYYRPWGHVRWQIIIFPDEAEQSVYIVWMWEIIFCLACQRSYWHINNTRQCPVSSALIKAATFLISFLICSAAELVVDREAGGEAMRKIVSVSISVSLIVIIAPHNLPLERWRLAVWFSIFKMRVRENIFKNNIYMYIIFLFALLRSS